MRQQGGAVEQVPAITRHSRISGQQEEEVTRLISPLRSRLKPSRKKTEKRHIIAEVKCKLALDPCERG